MSVENFAIRRDYVPNIARAEGDIAKFETYWNHERIQLSGRYQFGVYRLARVLAGEIYARTIFDFGCGPATKLIRFFDASFQIYGIDLADAIAVCEKLHKRGTYLSADFENLDSLTFSQLPQPDLIICADVIEHLQNPDGLLQSIHQLAGDDTRIVISTPDREKLHGPDSVVPVNPEHVREWSMAEFRTYLRNSRFGILEHQSSLPFRLLPDAMSLRYVLNRLRKRLPLGAAQVVVCQKS